MIFTLTTHGISLMTNHEHVLSVIPENHRREFFQLLEIYGGDADVLKSRLREFFTDKLELGALESAAMTSGAMELGKYLESS